MKVIVARILNEPAAAIGLAVSVALFFVVGGFHSTQDVVTILSPFASSIGIRQVVSPAYATVPKDNVDKESGE